MEHKGTSTDTYGESTGRRVYQAGAVRSRHLAVMDLMLTCPSLTQNEIAERLGYSPARLSLIIKSPLFQLAFQEYRRRLEMNLVEMITEATASAVKFSKEVIEDKDAPLPLRQTSARDILNQGHVRAAESVRVDRREIRANIEVPLEALEGLKEVILEAKRPAELPRRVFRPVGGNGEEDGKSEGFKDSTLSGSEVAAEEE